MAKITHNKTVLRIIGLSLFLLTNPLSSLAAQNPFLVIDASDGAIIHANLENDRWYPASLTKLMTAYVTMQAISNNEIKIGSPVRMSSRAHKMPASRMGYKIGTLLRVDTALKILIVKSANDVAIALAESVAGSVEKFADRMNSTAVTLGMSESHFVNPNGLHSKNQYTTANDLAILSRRLLIDFPQYSDWFAIPAIKTTSKTHYSYNLLLERFAGANGMKTGFVCASGYNMVASAKRNDRQLIAVILGSSSQTDRAVIAARLLSEAFANPNLLIGNILTAYKDNSVSPKNMRGTLCTPEARKQRYEPGAGKAKLKSTYLLPRKIIQKPLLVRSGGIDADPGKFFIQKFPIPVSRVKIPTQRPDANTNPDNEVEPSNSLRGTIPFPEKRPTN